MKLLKLTDKKWANKLMGGEIYANSIFNFRKIEYDFDRSPVKINIGSI